jgi:hypothetical protein
LVKRRREQELKSLQDIDKSHFEWYYNVSKKFLEKYKNGATGGVRFAIYRMKGGSFHGRQENN